MADSTRKLMEKIQMKMDSTGIRNIEYTETYKIIRKELWEDIGNFNSKMKKLHKLKKNNIQRRQNILNILDSNGKRYSRELKNSTNSYLTVTHKQKNQITQTSQIGG